MLGLRPSESTPDNARDLRCPGQFRDEADQPARSLLRRLPDAHDPAEGFSSCRAEAPAYSFVARIRRNGSRVTRHLGFRAHASPS
jgi:hypothetical protein